MTLEMFLSSFFTTLFSWKVDIFYSALLFIDGIIYDLVAKIYRLFMLVCQLNFNSLEAIIAPLVDRLKAVIMVFIMFKAGIALIKLMINPKDAPSKGTEMIKNIFIVGAMLICYNLVFSILNEVSMLIVGVPDGYSFTTLARIADITDTEDEGLINRFVFGENSDVNDIGDFVAFETLSMFIRDANDETTSETLHKAIADGDSYDFHKLGNLDVEIDKTVKYTPFISGIMGIYIMYCIGSVAIEVAVRMFKLIVLQLIAPVAIISKIDDKSEVFNNFIKAYTSTYLSAFFRILTVLIMNVFISEFIVNIREFFGGALAEAEGGLTKIFLTLIIIVAGYTFIKALPEFLKQITGKDFGAKDKGFGNIVGTTLGIGAGAAVGFASGFASGGLGTGLANMGAGAISGGVNGFKGNSISDKVKNLSGGFKKDVARADDWGRRGMSNVIGGAVAGAVGTKGRQDREMYRYDQATSALKAYEAAQIEEIKEYKMSDENVKDAAELSNYSGGYGSVKFGDNKDAYAEKMLEFDNSYNDAKAALENAQRSGDETKISQAQIDLATARQDGLKRAGDLYDKYKDAANGENVRVKRETAESAAKKADVALERKTNGSIDVKASNKAIGNKKQELENRTTYGWAHGAGKDK